MMNDWNNTGESFFDEYSGEITEAPTEYVLNAPYPNPFNPETTISFALPHSGKIVLSVFDVTGKQAAVLASGKYSAGNHSVIFDGNDLSSGVYFVRLNAGNRNFTKKCLLLK